MDHLCVDPHDAAATKIEMCEVDSAPDTPVAVVAVNEGADASSPALEEEQASADEDGGSIGDALCEVEAEASMFLQASAAELAPLQLSALTRRVEIAPLNAMTILSGVPVVSAVDEVYVPAPPNAYATSMAGYSQSAAAPEEDDAAPVGLWISPAETRIDLTAAAEEGASQELYDRQQQVQLQVDGTASSPREVPVTAAEVSDSQAWAIDFAPAKRMPTRKMTKKEKDAIKRLRVRRQTMGADSEGNTVVPVDASALTGSLSSSPLQVVQLDTLALDRDALIPVNLKTTRADLEARLVLRLPRLLCVNKQYPRACGIASLTSVYNYLYSWLGESAVGTNRPPHSQEEIMSILGFEPPFGEIAWGSFTGNATLIRWFHALNRHFGVRGRAYILYKVHGSGKTTHLYNNNTDALAAVKAALRDPHCALIYHCHNHYMVPIGYQDIPLAQADFLKPTVAESSCDTTIFIGEVSRGRHEAMYARKWSQIVKDIECKSPFFFNIRHPEQGVQRREPKKKLSKEGADEGADVTVRAVAATTATTTAAVAVAATAQMRDADGLQQRQQKRQAQELQGGNSSEAHSPAETILVALPNAIPHSGATVLRGISDNDVDADFLDDAASNTSSDTIEVMVFAATTTPPLPPAAPSTFLQQPLPHTSSSPAVSTMAALKPGLAKSPEDVGDGLSIATAVQLQALAAKVVAVAQPGVSHERNVSVSSAAQSAPLSPSGAASAPLANNAMASMNEAVSSVPASSPLPASSSPPPQQQPKLRTAYAGMDSAAEASHFPRSSPSPGGPKKERGNLHCIICFRNDEVEPNLGRYEDTALWVAGTAAASPRSSVSSLPRGGSFSSNEADV
uniref:Uncharacterized protein n=1 Tax=Leishmania guyanensis TaxID=5670 RepID=A0A1E1IP52_LEIGU|nr:hypothetical protein, conserved [Leishmania guyanensis]